jgi:hypothetical protein
MSFLWGMNWILMSYLEEIQSLSRRQSHVTTDGQAVCLGSKPPSGATRPDFCYCQDNCGVVGVGRPLWWEDGSVVYNTSDLCQRSHSRVRVPRDSWRHFTASDSRLHQPGGSGLRIYIPQEQGRPVITPGTGFPFLRLLRLARPSESKTSSWIPWVSEPRMTVLAKSSKQFSNQSLCSVFEGLTFIIWQESKPIAIRDLDSISFQKPASGCYGISGHIFSNFDLYHGTPNCDAALFVGVHTNKSRCV